MSSQLTTLVPVLEGPNYASWVENMQSYLMAQGQWRILTRNCPQPKMAKEAGEGDDPLNLDAIELWHETNTKALGNIRLRLHHSIQYKFRDAEEAGGIWRELKDTYGKPGIANIYLEFKGAIDTPITTNADPSLTIDKILAHFGRLEDAGVTVPEPLRAMMILAKLPAHYESTATMFCQQEKVAEIKVDALRQTILLAWEQKGARINKGGQAQKLSAVQQNPGEPQFQQQHDE